MESPHLDPAGPRAVSDRSPEAIFQTCDIVTRSTNIPASSHRVRPLAGLNANGSGIVPTHHRRDRARDAAHEEAVVRYCHAPEAPSPLAVSRSEALTTAAPPRRPPAPDDAHASGVPRR